MARRPLPGSKTRPIVQPRHSLVVVWTDRAKELPYPHDGTDESLGSWGRG